MPLLEASKVVAGYGQTEILHGISITVDQGEIVTIIGPNGCGKSTLMKAIVGLVPVRTGSVAFRGEDISGRPPEQIVRNRPVLRAPVQQRVPVPQHPGEPGNGGVRPWRRFSRANR